MSTQTEQPPATPPAHDPHDEYTGAFGFFRRYQKLILYTAVIFALVTFSITGAMTKFFGDLFSPAVGPMPSIEVAGQRVELTTEDVEIGKFIAANLKALPSVLPPIKAGAVDADLGTCFAILRRASIASGLDVSMAEVDRAIDATLAQSNEAFKRTDTPTQLAVMVGMQSLARYRTLVKEAMRIGNYVRLHSIGVDGSDAALLEQLLEGQEKVTLRYALFDRKELEKELKQNGDVTEEKLREWIQGKEDAEKFRLQVVDTNHVALDVGAAMYAGFDAAQWEEELKEFKLGEEQQKQLYEQEKEARFKTETGEFQPITDEAVQAQLTKIAQVEEVLNKLLAKMGEEMQETLKPLQEDAQRTAQEKIQFQADRDAAKAAAEAKPEDEELQLKARQAEEAFVAKENAATAAQEAVEAARKGYDFKGRFAELTKDKAGFQLLTIAEKKSAEDLKDLSSIGLGEWKNPYLATSLQNVGEISSAPARAQEGGFLFQATDVDVRPLKPWDKIKEPVEEAYWAEQSKSAGEEKKKAMEEALLRLAKETIADKVAEIEGKKDTLVQERFTAWENELKQKLEKAEQMLQPGRLTPGSRNEADWRAERERVQALLGTGEQKRTEIAEAVAKELESEVEKAAREKYSEVFEAAAQAAGFQLATIGPIWRDANRQPFFQKRAEKPVAFLMTRGASALKVGETTEVLEDPQERRYYIATATAVEPRTLADLTRREFAQMRANFNQNFQDPIGFEDYRVMTAVQQSFTKDALFARYKYLDPVGEQRETGAK